MPMLNREDHAREVARLLGMQVSDVVKVFKVEDEVELAYLREGYQVKRGKLSITEMKPRKARKRFNGFSGEMRDEPEKVVVEIRPLSKLTSLADHLNKKKGD